MINIINEDDEEDMDFSELHPKPPKELREFKYLLGSAISFTYEFDDDIPNVISKEQSLIVKDMERLVEDASIVRRIMDGMEAIFSKEAFLKKALSPTLLKKEGVTFAIEQESLIRLMLRVNKLQDPIFDLLKNELFRVCADTDDCAYLRLLLNSVKYLPNIHAPGIFSNEILDCLELSTIPLQLEILDCLPDIIPDNCYDCVANKLIKLLGTQVCPHEAVIECFANFDFCDDVKKSMFDSLMDKILPVRAECIPVALKLLFDTHKGKISTDIIFKLRDMIDNMLGDSHQIHLKRSVVKVIQSFSNKENIVQSILDVINSIVHPNEHKCFDLFVLLILGDDTKYKEIIRKKVESGHFTPELLKLFLLNLDYLDALVLSNQSLRSLVRLGGYLMKFYSAKIEVFTCGLFDIMFTANMEEDRFLVDSKETVECLLKACNNSDRKCVSQTLRIFWHLMRTHPRRFYENLHKLMGLLKKIDDFDLVPAKKAYLILCHIPYVVDPEHPYSDVMRNEISMAIRKQLMSSKRWRKSIGIMGAVVQIQGSVSLPESEQCVGFSQVQLIEIIDPPPPSIQEAITIMESVTVLTEGIPECTGLFYDELAKVSNHPVKIDFTVWMLRKIRSLLDRYVADSLMSIKEVNGLEYRPRYASSTAKKVISLNIGLMTAEPQKYEGSPMILLAPLIHLYRTMILGKTKDPAVFESLMSFMTCSFILPEMEYLDDLNDDQLKQVVDITFHTINYLKEIISAISRAISDFPNEGVELHKLLKERLELLLKFENMFKNCLTEISEHTFPQVYFHDCLKNKQLYETKKKPVKKKPKLSRAILDDSVASISSALSTRETQTAAHTSQKEQKGLKGQLKNFKENNIHFRELELLSLLKIIQYSKERHSFDYTILNFVLKDLVKNFKVALLKQTDLTQYNCQYEPNEQLKTLEKDLNETIKRFYDVTKELESLEPAEIENETNCGLITCYTYFLEIIHVILSAPVDSSNFIDNVHKVLNPRFDESGSKKKNRRILVEILIPHLKYCVMLSQGVLLFRIVDLVLGNEQNKQRVELILKLCDNIVFKHWTIPKFLPYSEKHSVQDTTFVLGKYFQELKISYLNELLEKISSEYGNLQTKNDYLPSLSIINYSNFHVLFVTLCSALRINVEKELKFMVKITTDMEKEGFRSNFREVATLKLDQLQVWKNTTNMMFRLMEIARNVKNRQNTLLSVFLKKSIPILKIFLDHGLPLFDTMFIAKMEMVVDILKSMQASTRFLHHLCCQSKMFKNIAVVSHIPSFRLVLEQLIYKVKALLVSHKCEDAFFLGNLKNKDIHGNTQISEVMEEDSQENEQDEDVEMLPSDDEADVTMEDDRSESLTF